MRLHSKIVIIFLSISFILITSNNALSNESEEQINKLIVACERSDNDHIQEMGFAPHREKAEADRIKGEYAYERIKDSYPDGTFPIVGGDSNKIWFFSHIKEDKNKVPKYIWHLIISPAPKVPQKDMAEAFLVNFDSKDNKIDKLDLLEDYDEDTIKKSIVDEVKPTIYTNNELTSADKATLDYVWKILLNDENMNLILCERAERRRSKDNIGTYDFTFYLNEITGEPNKEHGFRIVSSKVITSPGIVYGFVLNEDGSCLGNKKIIAK